MKTVSITGDKTVVTYKGHTVHCYGKLKDTSTIIYALSNGCEGHTSNYDYDNNEPYTDWEAFVKDWVNLEGVDDFNVIQLEVD
jgi:hypothetical protein